MKAQFVRVFHNNNPRDGMVFGFRPTDSVTEVFRYRIEDESRFKTELDIPEHVYAMFNVGHDPEITNPVDPQAVVYRLRGNRSLSIGDIVSLVDDTDTARYYAVAAFGWDLLTTPPRVDNQEQPGTTPWDAIISA